MKKFINDIKAIDVSIIRTMKFGFRFSFVLCLISTYILYFYIINPVSHFAFDIGYSLAKCSLMFFTCFFVGALATDKIKRTMM